MPKHYGIEEYRVVSPQRFQFGETLFGGSRFVRWSLTPILLTFVSTLPFLVSKWTWEGVTLMAGLEIAGIALLAAYWLPAKYGRIAFRIATSFVFLGYALYLIDEVSFSETPLKLAGSRAESSPRNAVLGFVTIGLPCLWYSIFGRFSFRKPDLSDNSQPESSYVAHFTDDAVGCRLPDGQIQRVQWNNLQSVVVRTTSDGPALPDVFWILSGSDSRCIIPQGATGDKALLEYLLKLPGFDSAAFIAAMGSASDQEFVCWRRPARSNVQKPSNES